MPQFQLLPENPSFGAQLGRALGGGIGEGLQNGLAQFHSQKQNKEQGKALAQAIGKPELGDLFAQVGPEYGKILLKEIGAENLADSIAKIQGIQEPKNQKNLSSVSSPLQMNVTEKITPNETTISEKELIQPPQKSREEIFKEEYKNAPSSQKKELLRAYQEQNKFEEEKRKTGLKDTQKIRQEYATEAKSAHKALESKDRMLKLIEKGDLSNPLVAGVANFLPKGFRESLLTNDSLAYESALFDEFGVLKGMFPGQIRTAEITLLEPKLASLFKNDEAKKQILKQGMEASRVALIKGKKAAEVEKEMPWLTTNAFEEEVNRRAQPEIDKLGAEILSNLEAIADKYSDIVNVYDAQGNVVGTVSKNQVNQLPPGFTVR